MAKEFTGPQVVRLGATAQVEDTLGKPAASNAWYKKARLMRREPTISLVRRLVVAPALASTWSYEKTEGAPEGAVDLIQNMLDPMRSHIVSTAFFGCVDFGWQPYELVFEVNESRELVIRKVKPLIQDFTDILIDAKTGAYAGLKQEKVELDVENTFLHAWDVEGTDWYGEPLMRNAESCYDDTLVVRQEANTYDKKISGAHWIIHFPIGTTLYNGVETNNYDIAVDIGNKLRANATIQMPRVFDQTTAALGVDTPEAWKIELVESSGATTTSFIARLQYLDALKARAFGVPERAVLEGQFGTKAEAQEHGEFAVVIVEMRHNTLCTAVNWHIVNRILSYNYGPEAENTVAIKPTPLTDKQREYYRSLYSSILANPEGFINEYDQIDTEAMRDALDIPTQAAGALNPFPTLPTDVARELPAGTENNSATNGNGRLIVPVP